MDSLLQVFHLIGALGLFIYGMVLMSESIQRLTGNRLRRAVSTVTRNPTRAYLSGLSLTALIQSSSVTSLMAVSFVQVGLLRLSEAYFVLLGANVGTTVTGWLVALTISKPSVGSLALPILACSLPLLFAQRRRTRSVGEAIIGFSLMFVGLGLLKSWHSAHHGSGPGPIPVTVLREQPPVLLGHRGHRHGGHHCLKAPRP